MENSKSINFLQSLRGKNHKEPDIQELLTDFLEGKDCNYLNLFQKTLNDYIAEEKKIMEDSYSKDEINAAIEMRKSKGDPELKIGALSGIITNKVEKKNEHSNKVFIDRTDIEGLKFPKEFPNLYKAKTLLEKMIADQKLQESEELKINNLHHINLIDLSDSNAKGKIIMLEELGVLKFLREMEPFKFSTNALSTAISGFTGIKAGTVQSYLNPMFSQKTIQKNNPMYNKKAVEKVKDRLANLGFKQSK